MLKNQNRKTNTRTRKRKRYRGENYADIFNDFITSMWSSTVLFGMSLMGDGLKMVAGNKLEAFLYRMTNTPIKGVALGTAVTSVIQSSSATTVW